MPRKDRSIIKKLKKGAYQPKFKVGQLVLKDGVEYFVVRPDNRISPHLTLERRFRPYAYIKQCVHKSIRPYDDSRRKSLKKGDFVRFDHDSFVPYISFVCERIGDTIIIQPLGVRYKFTLSIYSNCIDVVLHPPDIKYEIMPDDQNDMLQAKILCGEASGFVIDYHHLMDRYLVKLFGFHGVYRWFRLDELYVEHKVEQTVEWKHIGTLKFDHSCAQVYPKSMMDKVDMESVIRSLWHKVRANGQYRTRCSTDYEAYTLLLWLENHEKLFTRQCQKSYHTIADLEYSYADLMNSNDEIIPKEFFTVAHDTLFHGKQLERKLRGISRMRSNLMWRNGQFEVDVFVPEIMYTCCTHAEFNFISRILWQLKKPRETVPYSLTNATYDLKLPLKPFQNEIVREMVKREEHNNNPFIFETMNGYKFNAVNGYSSDSEFNGGILHLGTGLGKTICTLALIQHRRIPTLIVVPLTLIDQWISELKRFTHLSYAEVHGKKDMPETMPDVVFTTYGTLVSRNRAEHRMFYLCDRVIFDESHTVRTFHSSTATSCSCVIAKYRWCLSATPLREGSLMNISPQLKMLNVKPFRHAPSFLRSTYRDLFTENRCEYILQAVRDLIYKPTVDYKMPTIEHVSIKCNIQSHTLYTAMVDTIRDKVNALLMDGALTRKYQSIQSFINLMHIAATDIKLLPLFMWGTPCQDVLTHVEDIKKTLTGDAFKENVKKTLENMEDVTCVICLENLTRPTITPCNHLFCHDCIKRSMEVKQICPCCRAPLMADTLKEITTVVEVKEDDDFLYINDIFNRRMKVQKYIGRLYKDYYESEKLNHLQQIINSNDQVVVFSQFNTVLEMLAKHVDNHSIITGRSTRSQRKKNLERFKAGQSKVFLLSTKVADVGINLTEANAIVFMEPNLDATCQTQAIGRLKRIGQKNKVTVYHISTNHSIESQMIRYKPEYDQRISELKARKLSHSSFQKYRRDVFISFILKILNIR